MHPQRRPIAFAAAFIWACALAACGTPTQRGADGKTAAAINTGPLLPPSRLAEIDNAQAVLIGEQHDADDHHRIERDVVASLAARDSLAALALEMAERGNSTVALERDASEERVQQALAWNDKAWPWAVYGPIVMVAVRTGVPVFGANLPRTEMRDAMADATLDGQLPGPALKAQQQAIRIGHCNQLPETQITPMTRVQIARDRAMANMVELQVKAAPPNQKVVLISGAGHADRFLGVPQHLPRDMRVAAVKLQAGEAGSADRAGQFDSVWTTPALPPKDYCAGVTAPAMTPAPKP